jgi:hypothetical protein
LTYVYDPFLGPKVVLFLGLARLLLLLLL